VIYLVISIGILAGLLMVVDIPAGELAERITEALKPGNTSLKSKISTLTGKKKRNFIARAFLEAKEVLELTGKADKYGLVCRMSILLALMGGFFSIAVGNLLLLPVLSTGFAMVPLFYVKFSVGAYKKHLNGELETVLSVITTSYIRSGDIQKAVKENLEQLRLPVSSVFRRFQAITRGHKS